MSNRNMPHGTEFKAMVDSKIMSQNEAYDELEAEQPDDDEFVVDETGAVAVSVHVKDAAENFSCWKPLRTWKR